MGSHPHVSSAFMQTRNLSEFNSRKWSGRKKVISMAHGKVNNHLKFQRNSEYVRKTDEVESDQAREEPDESKDISHDRESRFAKNEHENFELKGRFCK
ncbi:hypothetical protein TNCV_4628561 [Trichonephila clavipes]|nr:hypothetical protein TNCV_4628561 [Trichonephila clavipes]